MPETNKPLYLEREEGENEEIYIPVDEIAP